MNTRPQNPVDLEDYKKVHGRPPEGIRRWRFSCCPFDSNELLLGIEADGEFAFIIALVQSAAQNHVGNCRIILMPTSGPPRPTGEPYETSGENLKDWQLGIIRFGWDKLS